MNTDALINPILRRIRKLNQIPPAVPSRKSLSAILDAVFNAGIVTEEGRRLTVRVVFVHPGFFRSDNPNTPKHELSYHECAFLRSRDFSAPELVRLAPVAEASNMMIVVSASDNDELAIRGLVNVGSGWTDAYYQQVFIHGSPPPPALTVTSVAPGELVVTVADETLAKLIHGKIVLPKGTTLTSTLTRLLRPATTTLSKAVGARVTDIEAKRDLRSRCQDAQVAFLCAILYRVLQKRHGGTILLVPDTYSAEDPRMAELLAFKYPCDNDDAWHAIVNKITVDRTWWGDWNNWSNARNQPATQPSSRPDSLRDPYEMQLDEKEAQIYASDTARMVADFTAVDGALVLTDRYRVLGFGAEIIVPSVAVDVVTASGIGRAKRIDDFGTRHRSAFRFCARLGDAIALIVSQDGTLRAAKRTGRNLTLWEDVELTSLMGAVA